MCWPNRLRNSETCKQRHEKRRADKITQEHGTKSASGAMDFRDPQLHAGQRFTASEAPSMAKLDGRNCTNGGRSNSAGRVCLRITAGDRLPLVDSVLPRLPAVRTTGCRSRSPKGTLFEPHRMPWGSDTRSQIVASACAFCRQNQPQNTHTRSGEIRRKANRYHSFGRRVDYWLLRLLPPESYSIKAMAVRWASGEV